MIPPYKTVCATSQTRPKPSSPNPHLLSSTSIDAYSDAKHDQLACSSDTDVVPCLLISEGESSSQYVRRDGGVSTEKVSWSALGQCRELDEEDAQGSVHAVSRRDEVRSCKRRSSKISFDPL